MKALWIVANFLLGSAVKSRPFYVAIITPVIHYCTGLLCCIIIEAIHYCTGGLKIDVNSVVGNSSGKAIPGKALGFIIGSAVKSVLFYVA